MIATREPAFTAHNRIPDDFLREVVTAMEKLKRAGVQGICAKLAETYDVPRSTIDNWLRKARQRGLGGHVQASLEPRPCRTKTELSKRADLALQYARSHDVDPSLMLTVVVWGSGDFGGSNGSRSADL